MVEGGGGGGGSGLVAVHDSAASWARGFSVRPRKWRRWGRGWTKKEEERAKERRRGGGGESDRGRAKEYERVGFAGSPLLIFPARLAASSFHFRSYTTLPPLSLSLFLSLASPPSSIFLHLRIRVPPSFFLLQRSPSSSLSRATLPRRIRSRIHEIYFHSFIYIYIQSCVCTHSHTEIFSVSSTRVNVLFCIHFCQSVGHWHPDSRTLSYTLVVFITR